jgi:lipopolysaccharide biosynthesis glycosyltransferase
MKNNRFCVTIIFDSLYIEPALITAYELLHCGFNHPIFLIFIDSSDITISAQSEVILSDFKNKLNTDQVNILKVANTLSSFNKFHFSNSIIYKILIPNLVEGYDFILNIDAGILLGDKSLNFFHHIIFNIENNAYKNAAVSAFLTDSSIDLDVSLQHISHNSKYPSGIILLFNVQMYNLNNLFTQIIDSWKKYSTVLLYAEQDLLCIIIEEGNFIQLPMRDSVIIEFLDLDGLKINTLSVGDIKPNFAFYKVCGTCKPWKYWVLDQRKSFYLKHRELFEQFFSLSTYEIIIKNRHHVTHNKLAEKFLESFESTLIK